MIVTDTKDFCHRRTLFGRHEVSADASAGNMRISLFARKCPFRRGSYHVIVDDVTGSGNAMREAAKARCFSANAFEGPLGDVFALIRLSESPSAGAAQAAALRLLRRVARALGESHPVLDVQR